MSVTFGSQVQKLREHNKFGLRECADKMGISHGYLSQIEKGLFIPKVQVIESMAETFKLNAEHRSLFFGLSGKLDPKILKYLQSNPEAREFIYVAMELGVSATHFQKMELILRKHFDSKDNNGNGNGDS